MGKKIVIDLSERKPYVYDGSAEAGRAAFARAHRDWKCLLCGKMQKAGGPCKTPGCSRA